MNWTEIKKGHTELIAASREGLDLQEKWASFAAACRATEAAPPYHLGGLLRAIEQTRGDRPRSAVRVLDHGCGSGLSLMYLAALGYQDINGVDVAQYYEGILPNIFKIASGDEQTRYTAYDGTQLPFESNSIDFVFSQQVLEHVNDSVLRSYYSEEARVVVEGGAALHGVPHRLVPYDSHTQSWILHMILPWSVWVALQIARGKGSETQLRGRLFLRWPWVHRRLMREYFGDCQDITIQRLKSVQVSGYYDGSQRMRGLVTQLVNMPVLGGLFASVLSNMVMLDTLSVKRIPYEKSL